MLTSNLHRARQRCTLAFWLMLSVAFVQAADGTLRIIELKHRTVDEILPVVQPLVGPAGAASGRGFQLFVRTSARNLREIERVLALVDVPRRNLKITVRQTVRGGNTARAHEFAGSATVGKHTRVIISEASPNRMAGVEIGHGKAAGTLRYKTRQRTVSREHGASYFLRVLEGQRAFIRVGQSLAQLQPLLALSQRRLSVRANVAFESVDAGFEVLPRLHGRQVEIEITPKLSFHSGRTIHPVAFHELRTTVLVAIGEWVDLGSALESSSSVARAILGGGTTRVGQRYTVIMKVE